MKKGTKKKTDVVKPNEFRYNKARGGHPAYIVKVIQSSQPLQTPPKKKARFIGLTESPETQGMSNVPLDVNPNPDKRGKIKAYARPNVDEVVLTEKTFSKKLNGWEFDLNDKEKIRVIIVNDSKKTKK